jgi:alanine-synthesizing transaminase
MGGTERGVSCVKPKGALFAFPKIDLSVYPIRDDEQFVLDLLLQEKIHIVLVVLC